MKICFPVNKEMDTVVKAGTDKRCSKNECQYMDTVEQEQRCTEAEYKRNYNCTDREEYRLETAENVNKNNDYSNHGNCRNNRYFPLCRRRTFIAVEGNTLIYVPDSTVVIL